MNINLKATPVFEKNWAALQSKKRWIVNQGGSRSSKTYSLCQCFVLLCLQTPNILVSIIRKTGPSLNASVIRDLVEVMRTLGVYDSKAHEIKNQIYRFPNGSAIEWFPADDEQKLRGRKRDYGWLNEANELTYEDVQQIALRTTKKIVCDFNPSQPDSWLYDLPEDKCELIHSTYHDNSFLTQEIRDQIESYRNSDPDYYTIFALGQRAFSSENVFREWPGCSRPEHLRFCLRHRLWVHPPDCDGESVVLPDSERTLGRRGRIRFRFDQYRYYRADADYGSGEVGAYYFRDSSTRNHSGF